MSPLGDVKPNKDWARRLRLRWLGGEELDMQQVVMPSSALNERWHTDGGPRQCDPLPDAE